VTRRFPTLKMEFLEGGVGWACGLYSDLIGHWKKRNLEVFIGSIKSTLHKNLQLNLRFA
jgi:hypothetical protein